MANRNRTEVAAAIEALAAIVDLEELKEALNDFFAQSCVFRKDVASSDTAASATKTVSFLDIDYIAITQSTNVTYTLTNVQQGEIKYLKITKSSGQTIAFSGATDITPDPGILTAETVVYYNIFNKDGVINLLAVNKIVGQATTAIAGIAETSTAAEAQGFSSGTKIITPSNLADIAATTAQAEGFTISTRFLTPSNLQHVRADTAETTAKTTSTRFVTPSTMNSFESWTNITPGASFTGTLRVALDNIGNIHLHADLTKTSAQTTNAVLGTIASGFRPAQVIQTLVSSYVAGVTNIHLVLIDDSTGIITWLPDPDTYQANYNLGFYLVFR